MKTRNVARKATPREAGDYSMELKAVNRAIGAFIMLTNIYFVPFNFLTVRDAGGPMGYGLLVLPLLLLSNILLIPAVLTFSAKFKNSKTLFVVNALGLLGTYFGFFSC